MEIINFSQIEFINISAFTSLIDLKCEKKNFQFFFAIGGFTAITEAVALLINNK